MFWIEQTKFSLKFTCISIIGQTRSYIQHSLHLNIISAVLPGNSNCHWLVGNLQDNQMQMSFEEQKHKETEQESFLQLLILVFQKL